MRKFRTWASAFAIALLLAACGNGEFGGAESPEGVEDAAPDENAAETAEDLDRDQVTIRMVTSFTHEAVEHAGFRRFQEILEEEAPWIDLDYRGGPETIPSQQQGEAVADGAVDMATLPANFYSAQIPLMHSLKLSTMTPAEERESGAFDVYQEHHDSAGMHYLGRMSAETPFRLFMNEPLDELDLSGLDIRVSPVYVQVVQGLGGTPTRMDPGDVYTALERGVVDGYGWAGVGLTVHGWQDVTEYEVDIDFYQMDMVAIVNQEFWDGLDEETKDAISSAALQAEEDVVGLYGELVEQEVESRREAGIEPLQFTEQETAEFLEMAYERGWVEAVEFDADAERLREVYGMPEQAQTN